jgi:nicotinamide riboside kinase
MTKLIAITGTHGTGKTTLSFQLAAEYKKLGANVKIIQEVARSCPFPLNADMTRDTALWIYHEHSKKELEACRDHDVVICDRTSFDSFVYAEVLGITLEYWERKSARIHLDKYDELYFVRPDDKLPKDDGIRSMDLDFQNNVDALFYTSLFYVSHDEINSSQIFDKDHKWNISY